MDENERRVNGFHRALSVVQARGGAYRSEQERREMRMIARAPCRARAGFAAVRDGRSTALRDGRLAGGSLRGADASPGLRAAALPATRPPPPARRGSTFAATACCVRRGAFARPSRDSSLRSRSRTFAAACRVRRGTLARLFVGRLRTERSKSPSARGMLWPISFSIATIDLWSSDVTIEIAVPVRPARPVRPMRWT